MSNVLDYFAQPVGDFGDITGAGLGNLLGAPSASPIETLLREAMQNSWDARLPGVKQIGFDIEFRTLNSDEKYHLLTNLLKDRPDSVDLGPNPTILVLRDRGTRGLAGPVRPSDFTEGYRDFVNFVYMVGETKPLLNNNGVSGGTYGYGRSSLFKVSDPRVVLVHTRCLTQGDPISRFIGMGWTDKFHQNGREFTGRHWWGRQHSDGWVGPEVGDAADQKLAGLGIEPQENTGTILIVINPLIGPPDTACERVIETILRNAWAKIITREILFGLTWEGVAQPIPDPTTHPAFKPFCKAFLAIDGDENKGGTKVFPIDCQRPQAHLGKLGLSRVPYVKGVTASAQVIGTEGPLRHVALMRSNKLVVKYLEAAQPIDGEQYGGVFLVDPVVEEVFAQSEPPSHDEWVPQRLTNDHHQRYIRVGLRRLIETARLFVQPQALVMPTLRGSRVVQIAQALNLVLPDTLVPRGERHGVSHGSKIADNPIGVVESTATEVVAGGFRRTVSISVKHTSRGNGTLVRPALTVITDGGTEREAPLGVDVPRILRCEIDGVEVANCSEIPTSSTNKIVNITFFQPMNCETRLNLVLEELNHEN